MNLYGITAARGRALLAATLLVGLLAVEAQAGGGGPKTQLVSRQSQSAGGAGGDQSSYNPSVSANGRYVAFQTFADNLGGPIDTFGSGSNVYVYDRERRRVELISRRSNNGPGADDSAYDPEISASGRYVTFTTSADNLGGPLDVSVQNVYVYDRERNKVRLVSRRSGRNGVGADASASGSSPSANGRFVVFTTQADNLGGPLDTSIDNIYVYDLETRRVRLVSRRSGRNGAGANGNSFVGSLSASGRFVAFETEATNLGGPTQTDPLEQDANVYVYDRETRKVVLVSRRSKAAGGAGGNDSSADPFISANGRFVAFETNAANLGGPIGTADPVSDDSIYVYDRERERVELVSRRSQGAGGQGANDDSDDPVLSRDGRYVAFETDATNLGGPLLNDPAPDDNAYLYDRERNQVELVGRASGRNGAACDDDCGDPYVSMNGRFVAFETEADNLGGPLDTSSSNVYVRDRG